MKISFLIFDKDKDNELDPLLDEEIDWEFPFLPRVGEFLDPLLIVKDELEADRYGYFFRVEEVNFIHGGEILIKATYGSPKLEIIVDTTHIENLPHYIQEDFKISLPHNFIPRVGDILSCPEQFLKNKVRGEESEVYEFFHENFFIVKEVVIYDDRIKVSINIER